MKEKCKICGKKLKANNRKDFNKDICYLCNTLNKVVKKGENDINSNLINTKSKKQIKISWKYEKQKEVSRINK